MDNTQPSPLPEPVQNNNTQSPLQKLKQLSTKKKILLAGVVFFIIGILGFLFLSQSENPTIRRIFKADIAAPEVKTANLPNGVVADVGGVEIPEEYLNTELSYYPGSPSEEVKKNIVQKMVDDQITLVEAKKEGYINDFPSGENLSSEQYLERAKLVEETKQKINMAGNVSKGRVVSVWFYNNGHVGPKGLEESKKIAYAKIKPLYDRVKNGTMTIDQAGQAIANDPSLLEIDLAYKGNAIDEFTFFGGGTGTFWEEFNELIWATEQGGVTPLYLGGGALLDGKPVEELYIFAKVEYKSTNESFNSYADWLRKKKENLEVSISNSLSFFNFNLIKEVYADNDNDNTFKSGSWVGHVRTQTGVGIAGADAVITTGCNGPGGKHMTTDGNGYFDTGVDGNLSCVCAPHTITANVPNMTCDSFREEAVGNPIAEIRKDITCRPIVPPPTPTPPPPPINRCDQACTEDSFCAQTTADNCSKCLPSANGGKTCQPPPPPIQCNAVCTDDTFCASAVNGCTHCLPNPSNPAQRTCQQTPRCGNLCITPADCNGAQNGCTLCLPDQANPGRNICQEQPKCGSSCATSEYCSTAENGCTNCIQGASGATCGACPAGQVYDAVTKSCKCPIPGETIPHKVCDGDKCLDVNTCGITTCGDDKACFAEEMCKCDGFDAVTLEYPSTKPFVFDAYAKVEGTDMSKAFVEGITFKMSESDKANPNVGNIIAQSQMYTPQIVSSTSSKVRYKATWSLPAPQIKTGKTYRVFADIKCSPKKRTAVAQLPANQYQSKVMGLVKEANAQDLEIAGDDLQLKTLNFVKKGETDMCRFMTFQYNEGL